MSERETLEDELRSLTFSAGQLKLDLHDLAEDLPLDWERIPEVAERTHAAYARIAELREQIAALA
ncbi:MAG: hypothetical protein CVT62_03505 [Actinobacteria bacterium HGW-Actinobacteria-2]|nr:MAG: hypothetical protein CVT62_03505 [Actinobacteria bacterium HGW-Actinobacteria-2]